MNLKQNRRFTLIGITLISISIIGCSNENKFDANSPPVTGENPIITPSDLPVGLQRKGYIEKDTANFRQRGIADPVDMIFSIDNSGSMDPYIAKVQAEIEFFVQRMTERNINFRIGILRATNVASAIEIFEPTLRGPSPIVNRTDSNVAERIRANFAAVRAEHRGGSEVSISILRLFYREQESSQFFRRNSLHVYFPITDAEDIYEEYYSAEYYRDLFNERAGAGNWLVTGIGSPSYAPCIGTENTSQPTLENLARMSRGKVGRICTPDYSSILEEAIDQILSAQTEFSPLAAIRDSDSILDESIQVEVDDQIIPRDSLNGFTWDPINKFIAFDGIFQPNAGQRILVKVEKYVP